MDGVAVMRPRIPTADDVVGYLRTMDATRIYANFGPLVGELERRYADRFNVPAARVVSCSSATLGMQGVIEGLPPARVHCPAWTFPATPLAIVNAGREVLFHDVVADDWQLDVSGAEDVDDVILPVLPFGAEIDLDRWAGWRYCVIDAAASGGAVSRDLSGLPADWAVVVSLHATKVLGIGEGGMVIFGDADRAERFRSFSSFGFLETRESDIPGSNAKMSESSAAYGLAALDNWDVEEAEWRSARALVQAAESELGIGSICSEYPGVNPYWVVRLPEPGALASIEGVLGAAGVETRRWWPRRCDQMGAFAVDDRIDRSVALPVSEDLSATVLGLPFYRGLVRADVDRIVRALAPALMESR